MRSPPLHRIVTPRRARAGALAALGVVALVALPAAAQQPPDQVPNTGFSMTVDAIIGGAVTLLVGGGLIALAPEFTERTTDRALDEPLEAFLYGLGIFVLAFVLMVLLFVTVVGIILVIPLIIALVVVGEIGYLAVGRAFADEWGVVLLVAIVLSAFASGVPFLGGLVGFVVACVGIGAWYLDYRDDSGTGSDFEPSYAGGPDSTGGADAADEWGAESRASTDEGTGWGNDADDAGSVADDVGETGGPGDDDADGDPWTAGFDDEDRE